MISPASTVAKAASTGIASDAGAAAALVPTGPSFAAALCGFLSTTVATTALIVLLGTVA